jgi:hypothetical protein
MPTVKELRAELKAAGLPSSGLNVDMIARLDAATETQHSGSTYSQGTNWTSDGNDNFSNGHGKPINDPATYFKAVASNSRGYNRYVYKCSAARQKCIVSNVK